MPSGTPMRIARPNPLITRLSVAAVLSGQARPLDHHGTPGTTSSGPRPDPRETTRASPAGPPGGQHPHSGTAAPPRGAADGTTPVTSDSRDPRAVPARPPAHRAGPGAPLEVSLERRLHLLSPFPFFTWGG